MLQELRDSLVAPGTRGYRNDERAQAFCIPLFLLHTVSAGLTVCLNFFSFFFPRVYASLNIHLEVETHILTLKEIDVCFCLVKIVINIPITLCTASLLLCKLRSEDHR